LCYFLHYFIPSKFSSLNYLFMFSPILLFFFLVCVCVCVCVYIHIVFPLPLLKVLPKVLMTSCCKHLHVSEHLQNVLTVVPSLNMHQYLSVFFKIKAKGFTMAYRTLHNVLSPRLHIPMQLVLLTSLPAPFTHFFLTHSTPVTVHTEVLCIH
jgi:hypothetical protein